MKNFYAVLCFTILLSGLSLSAKAQRVISEEGRDYQKKTIVAEPAREELRVRRDGVYNITLRPQLWLYKFKNTEMEAGFFVPGCDIVFRHPYDPRWDVFVERTNVYTRTEVLVELLPGLSYATALHMQQHGYLTGRPASWKELERELDRYDTEFGVTIKTHVLYSKDYYQTNLVNLGAVRPGFELECGGTFVHRVYDYLRKVREPVNDRQNRDIAWDFEREIEVEVEGSRLQGRESDEFVIFYDGEVVSISSSRRNSADYQVFGPDQTGRENYWLLSSAGLEAPNNGADARWGRRDATAFLVYDENSERMFFDFEDFQRRGADFRSTVKITVYEVGSRRTPDIELLRGWEIDADRNGVIEVDLEELLRLRGKREMRRGENYYVEVRYHRVGSDRFGQEWSEKINLPDNSGLRFEELDRNPRERDPRRRRARP